MEARSMTRKATTPTRADVLAVAGKARGMVRSTVMAERLGVHARTIRRCFQRGGLPGAKEHGERILEIPAQLLRLAEAYGLRTVEAMAKAGKLNLS
jgi:hypothetical protein